MNAQFWSRFVPMHLRSPLYDDNGNVYRFVWWEWRGHLSRMKRIDYRLPWENK